MIEYEGLADKYRITVRNDIMREIEHRGGNEINNTFGMGVSSFTFVRDKSLYNRLITNYKSMVAQLEPEDVQEQEMEQLFQEDEYDAMEMAVEPEPSESIHVNTRKRKQIDNDMNKEMKRNKRDETPQYPAIMRAWYEYWAEKLKKGFLTDVPKEFTRHESPPTLAQFIESKSGDAILKYSKFASKQFQ